jgi:tryptophanyl-tRNA synthetase
MTQFKDKSNNADSNDTVSAGLYNYPVLMAADILLYDASYIPLGDDQKQHLELARDLAMRINNKFGKVFEVPHEWKKQLEFSDLVEGVRIRSLRNPDKKMSKSVSDPAGTILLSDKPEEAAKKIMSATTDNVGVIGYDWDKQPGISNLLRLEALVNNKDQDEINKLWVGKQSYGDLKTSVAESVENFLNQLQENLKKVDEVSVVTKLKTDETKMNEKANNTLAKVQVAVGLRPN